MRISEPRCLSGDKTGGVVGAKGECVGSGVALGSGGAAVAFGAEAGSDLVMGGKKSLGMNR